MAPRFTVEPRHWRIAVHHASAADVAAGRSEFPKAEERRFPEEGGLLPVEGHQVVTPCRGETSQFGRDEIVIEMEVDRRGAHLEGLTVTSTGHGWLRWWPSRSTSTWGVTGCGTAVETETCS